MVIGFHYHIPISVHADGRRYTQSFYGLFLDALSGGCEELIVFSYSPVDDELPLMNYEIETKNIRIIDLGPHESLPRRIWRFRSVQRIIKEQIGRVDFFMVRSPTPLLPVFAKIHRSKRVVLYIVGDFLESARALPARRIKTVLIKLLGVWLRYAQDRIVHNNLVIANNPYLLERYKEFASETVVIKSTTLKLADIYKRENSCEGSIIRILYTGRIDPLKGLFDILKACEKLFDKGFNIEFHMAGILLKGLESLPGQLKEIAGRGKFADRVFFHGLKSVGPELNQIYRMADIYIIASKGMEGFPKTIWEAMANGLPVVAPNLGAIPILLRDQEDALLIEPGNVESIYQALVRVITDRDLRQKMIVNGQRLAEENTLDKQALRMIRTLKKLDKRWGDE